MAVSPRDRNLLRVDEKGRLHLPAHLLEAAELGAKMTVQVIVEGMELRIVKHAGANPLDGPLVRDLDHDLFRKVAVEQEQARKRAEQMFEKGLEEVDPDDTEPPDHPFRWD